MAVVNLSDRVDRRNELISDQGQADRFLRISKELKADIEKLREMQLRHVYNDMEARHLAGVIQMFTDKMNKYKVDEIKLRAM